VRDLVVTDLWLYCHLPDRDVTRAVGSKRLPLPASPSLAQPHSGDPRHQVEFGRPDVAKRHVMYSGMVTVDPVVVGDEALHGDVVLVESEPGGAYQKWPHRLAGWQSLEFRNRDLDCEAATWFQVGGSVPEAFDLFILRRQIHDRIPDHVDDLERPVDSGGGGVANGDADVLGAGLCLQSFNHRRGEINAMHAHAPLTERQRDAASADAELECAAFSRQVREEAHGRGKDIGREHIRGCLVEALRCFRIEVDLLRHDESMSGVIRERQSLGSDGKAQPSHKPWHAETLARPKTRGLREGPELGDTAVILTKPTFMKRRP